MKHLLPCLLLPFTCLIAKEEALSPPPLPAGYAPTQAISHLASAPDPAVMPQLRAWTFHHSFGGRSRPGPALEHPRHAQALWLALTTHAVELKTVPVAEACDLLRYLQRQKALTVADAAFFSELWQTEALQPQRATDYLRGWLQAHKLPQLSEAEKAALASAIRAGCSALACFEKNPPPAQSTSKP